MKRCIITSPRRWMEGSYYLNYDRFGFDKENPANIPAYRSMAECMVLYPEKREQVFAELERLCAHIEPPLRRERFLRRYREKIRLLFEGSARWVFREPHTAMAWIRPPEASLGVDDHGKIRYGQKYMNIFYPGVPYSPDGIAE